MKIQSGIAALAMMGMFAFAATTAQAGGACCAGKASGTKVSSASSGCNAKAMQAGGGTCTMAGAKHCDATAAECEKWMREHYKTHGWLGVDMNCDGIQPTVTRIVENSPTEKAGFKAGDVLTSINGVSFTAENEAKISELMKNGFKIGETVSYTANRGGEVVNLTAKLEKVSDAQLSQLIAAHVADMQHKAADKAENVN